MNDATGPKGFSKAVGNKYNSDLANRGQTLLDLSYVEQFDDKKPYKYRIVSAGRTALTRYEREYGTVELNNGLKAQDSIRVSNDIDKIYHRHVDETERETKPRERRNRERDETERETFVSARIGQGQFRNDALAKWGNRCAVTEIDLNAVIRASHIKPWRECSDSERLDPDNGLPLIANLDALFDVGLISFDDKGELLSSSALADEQIDSLDLRNKRLCKTPNKKTQEYLAYHWRENEFEH